MADWDKGDLLARCKRLARRPATDESFADADWYALLTEAEAHWKPIIAAHAPGAMYEDPTLMTTSDGGYTYVLGSNTNPMGWMEIYASRGGRPLTMGAYWDANADYVQEGGTIRMTNGRQVTFSDGPYARFVAQPAAITASVDSTISPDTLRILLVYHAVKNWAAGGAYGDPAFFHALEQEKAWGNPQTGDIGIIGALKTQSATSGMAAYSQGGNYAWWRPNG